MKLGHIGMMLHVGPSFVLHALLLDLGCCPRAHFELDGQFESEQKIQYYWRFWLELCTNLSKLGVEMMIHDEL